MVSQKSDIKILNLMIDKIFYINGENKMVSSQPDRLMNDIFFLEVF